MKHLLYKIFWIVAILAFLVLLCLDRTPPNKDIKITNKDIHNLKSYVENNFTN